jgi:hypothetical protein
MAKKIRLVDEPESKLWVTASQIDDATMDKFMKYAEAIDWKLWEILKILRKQTGEEQE